VLFVRCGCGTDVNQVGFGWAVAEGWDWWLDRLLSAICHGRSGLQEALIMYVARSEQTQTLRSVDAKHETVRYLRLHGVRLSICQGNIAVNFGS
jgi:hypothetical protein